MSSSEANKAAIAANRKTIFNIESNVLSNKALVYQSRSMIEENRLMIMSNYSAAFMGNRQLAMQIPMKFLLIDPRFSPQWTLTAMCRKTM